MQTVLLPACVLACLVAAGPVPAARAEAPRVTVVMSGTAPCSPHQLSDALALRAPRDATGGGSVEVVAVSREVVSVRVGQRARTVALGGARGISAARLIALAVADLVWDDRAVPAITWPAAPLATVEEGPHAHRAPPRGRFALALRPGIGVESDSGLTLTWLGAAVDRRIGRRWQVGLEGQLGASPAREVSGQEVALAFGSLRTEAGYRISSLELRAAGLISWYRARGGFGDSGFTAPGAGLGARLSRRISAHTAVDLGAGLDVYATRADYQVHGTTAFETPFVLVWTRVGLAWEMGR